MKAVYIQQQGGLDVLTYGTVPDPLMADDEVIVRVRAAGMNRLDLNVRSGEKGVRVNFPHIPGLDMAGEIVDVSPLAVEKFGLSVGDRVVVDPTVRCMTCRECVTGRDHWCAFAEQFGIHRNGGYAELVNAPARNVYKLPDWMTFEEAAAIPLAFKTAWHMMVEKAKLEPGEDILIQAVGSGVGSAALQIATFFGCRAFVTAGADWKLETARKDWGADAGINYRTQDVAQRVLELTDGKGVDMVVDNVGVDTFESSLRSLRKDGRYILCGVTSGHKAEVHLGQVFTRGLSIMGVGWWRNAEFATIWKLAERRIFKGVVFKTFPLTQAREAHAFMEGRDFYGKIVLKP